jgi:hypothetical protein
VFGDPIESFIRIILDVMGQDLQLPIADQSLVDQARKHQIIENSSIPR